MCTSFIVGSITACKILLSHDARLIKTARGQRAMHLIGICDVTLHIAAVPI
jgi:hypothetical protein